MSDVDVRVVVLAGTGPAFCTGQNVAAADELADAGATLTNTRNPLARILREMPKPSSQRSTTRPWARASASR